MSLAFKPAKTIALASGQSLQEYALVGGLVAAVCIVGVFNLTSTLQNSLNETLSGAPSNTVVAVTPPTLQPPSSVSVGNAAPSTLEAYWESLLNQQPKQTLTLPNGQQIQVPSANMNLPEALAPNGQTEVQLAAMQALIEQLKANGGDPAVISSLEALANQGHAMADAQKPLDTVYQKILQTSDDFKASQKIPPAVWQKMIETGNFSPSPTQFSQWLFDDYNKEYTQGGTKTDLMSLAVNITNNEGEFSGVSHVFGVSVDDATKQIKNVTQLEQFRLATNQAVQDLQQRGYSPEFISTITGFATNIQQAGQATARLLLSVDNELAQTGTISQKPSTDPSYTLPSQTSQENANQICLESRGGQCIRFQ